MKTKSLLFIFLISITFINAQIKNLKIDSVYFSSSNTNDIVATYYTYNKLGVVISESTVSITDTAKEETFHEIITYDDSKNITEVILYLSSDHSLKPYSKSQNTYSNNKLTSSLSYKWNDSSQQWEISEKHLKTYSPTNKIISDTSFLLSESEIWTQSNITSYTYNTSDNLSSILNDGTFKTEFLYTSTDKLKESIEYKWNTLKSIFEPTSKTTNQYNEHQHLSVVMKYEYEISNINPWFMNDSTFYTYDNENNNLIKVENFFRFKNQKNWSKRLTTFEIDYTKLADETIHLIEPTEFFKNIYTKLVRKSWDNGLKEYVFESQLECFFSPYTLTSLDYMHSNTTLLYPNPAKNQITVDLSKGEKGSIQIYNSKGDNIWSEQISLDSSTIDISQFETGFYTYRFSTDIQNVVGKFVKE